MCREGRGVEGEEDPEDLGVPFSQRRLWPRPTFIAVPSAFALVGLCDFSSMCVGFVSCCK